jgi:predicted permease
MAKDTRREVEEEIRTHLEMRVADLVETGHSPDEAATRARLEFGDVNDAVEVLARHGARRARRRRWAGVTAAWWRDVKLAARSFRRAPLVPAIVVATLALGIGANTAVYSLVDALVFRPLPFGEGARLVRMRDATRRPDGETWLYNSSSRSYHRLRESGVFESITAQRYRLFHVTGAGEEPVSLTGIGVSSGWLETLRVTPVVGRDFTAAEEAAGRGARVVLVGHELWQRRLGGDPAIAGRTLTLDGEPYAVVGVLPPRFNYPYGSELWVPDDFDPSDVASGPNVAARLLDGEDLASTQEALEVVSDRAAQAFPESHDAIRFLAVPQRVDLLGNQPRLAWVLLGAVGFLLLIACANVANLLVVRAVATRRDRAVQTALGASRSDHARRLLVESALMALAGGALGLVVADLLLDPMASLSVRSDSSLGAFFSDLRLDARVTTFAAFATVVTSLFFGVAPALAMLRADPMAAIRGGGRSADGGGHRRGTRWARQGLVVAEVALSVVLLAGATLLLRDYARLQGADPGFEADGRLVATLTLPDARFQDGVARHRFMGELSERLATVPGVAEVSWVDHLPVSDGSSTWPITADGGPASTAREMVLANIRRIGPDYFGAMGIRFLRGRAPTRAEIADGAPVVVVSRSAARRYWPGQDPVGRRVRFGMAGDEHPWYRVVGVVSQVREEWELADTWYVPVTPTAIERAYVVLRTTGRVAGVAGRVRPVVRALDPDQPVERVVSLSELVSETYTSERHGTWIIGSFATVGLLLAMLGIYGVLSHSVRSDVRSLGIRMALGAGAARVRSMVLRQGATLVAIGLLLGGAGAAVLTRGLARFLTGEGRTAVRTLVDGGGLGATDYLVVVCVLASVGFLACYVPARRAARAEPAAVLRDG